jgi:hypothetical protein
VTTDHERPRHGWTCFHCGETFTTVGAAQDHFGADPDSEPGCILKVKLGQERGLLMTLRRIEDGLGDLRHILNEEHWSTDKSPQDAVERAWAKVHDLMAVIQTWRTE